MTPEEKQQIENFNREIAETRIQIKVKASNLFFGQFENKRNGKKSHCRADNIGCF